MEIDNQIEHLTVDFLEAEHGWLDFKISVGDQSFADSFSDVYDPLLDLKQWLEAITIGVQQASFQYDNESSDIKLNLERHYRGKETFTISEVYNEKKVYIHAQIDRKQLIKVFYHGLLTFANSDKYLPRHWEDVYAKERLCKILNIDEKELEQQLIKFNNKELGVVMYYADTMYHVSPSEKITDKSAELIEFMQVILGKKNEDLEKQNKIDISDDWFLPDEYNDWTTEKKRVFIVEYLNEEIDGFDGMKLSKFQSSIIDNYLDIE